MAVMKCLLDITSMPTCKINNRMVLVIFVLNYYVEHRRLLQYLLYIGVVKIQYITMKNTINSWRMRKYASQNGRLFVYRSRRKDL